MDFNEYQHLAKQTAVYPNQGTFQGLLYCVLGLNGEAGEVAEKIKKIYRDKHCLPTTGDYIELNKELGDLLWYISQCCQELNFLMGDVAINNIAKLDNRKQRNVLRGDGDNR